MKKIIFIIFILLFYYNPSFSQNQGGNERMVYTQIIDGDTLFVIPLDEVEIKSKKIRNKKVLKRTNRLIYNIKKVYPYAKIAGQKLIEYDSILRRAKNESEKRKLMRQAEKEIKEEYESDLRKLTFTQGKILIKLIDRETGDTSYQLVRDLRGGFTAFFYQTFARIFGFNLKVKYDPDGEDRKIEEIVCLIEMGML